MTILAMYSNTCTYERQFCFDVCFHLLSCFTRLPTSTALQATPNPTTPDVMGPPWPEHTRQSRSAPCPQSFGTLPSRRKKNPQIFWDDLRVKEHVKYACTPLLGYPTTMCPCLTMQVPFLHASDPMNLRGVFLMFLFQNHHLHPLTT